MDRGLFPHRSGGIVVFAAKAPIRITAPLRRASVQRW
jgi:hypothetical protein